MYFLLRKRLEGIDEWFCGVGHTQNYTGVQHDLSDDP